jgi:hypothetical protein
VAGISSFGRRSRARPRASGVALWSSARRISSVILGLPGGGIIERRDRRCEPVAEEQPAPSDPPRGEIAATCELVDGRARDAEQLGDLPGRHDVCACQRARGWRSHLPKRGPEPPKRTPGGDFGWRLRALRDGGCSAGSTGTQPSGLLVSDCHAAGCRNHAEAEPSYELTQRLSAPATSTRSSACGSTPPPLPPPAEGLRSTATSARARALGPRGRSWRSCGTSSKRRSPPGTSPADP